jgi:hypothetical protein
MNQINYETLKRKWERALKRCRFFRFNDTQEILNWNAMSRCVESGVLVRPLGFTMGNGLFELGAMLSWGWSALQTARYHTTEDDILAQMVGPDTLENIPLPTTEEDTQSEMRIHAEIKVHIRRDRTVYPAQFDLNGLANGIAACIGRFFESVKDHKPESPADPYFYVCWVSEPGARLRWTDDGFAIDAIVVELSERFLLPRAWDWVDESYPTYPIDGQLDSLLGRVREAMESIVTFLDNFQGEKRAR